MPPAPPQAIPTPVSADIYSEALEQQLALVRDLLSPRGPTLFRDPMLPPRYTLAQDARWIAALVARAQPFFWSAHLARAILAAAQTMPAYTFSAESFPCPDGFVWFEEPIDLLDEDKLPVRVRALLWSTLEASPEGLPVLLHTFSPAAERPPGIPALRSVLYLGSTLQQIDERAAAGELLPDEPAYVPALYGALLRFLAACLSFLEQRIALAVERPASRGTRRRLAREYPTYRQEPLIRVIELRRRDSERPRGSGAGAPDWHWQWIVSPHWRRQYYPASGVHKPRFIAKYVKGPPDRPLKAPAGPIFAVTR